MRKWYAVVKVNDCAIDTHAHYLDSLAPTAVALTIEDLIDSTANPDESDSLKIAIVSASDSGAARILCRFPSVRWIRWYGPEQAEGDLATLLSTVTETV